MARSVLSEELRVLDEDACEAREEEAEALRAAAEAEAAEVVARAQREAEALLQSAEERAAKVVSDAQAKAVRVRRALTSATGVRSFFVRRGHAPAKE